MKGVQAVIVAGALLAGVLLAGAAAAGESSVMLGKSGGNVTITGYTNLAAGDRMLVEVVSAAFTPTEKGNGTGFPGAAGTVVVQPGSPLNTYRFEVNVSSFPPGLYLVSVKSLETAYRYSGRFTLPWTPVPTGIPTEPADVSLTSSRPPAQATQATQSTQAPRGSPTEAPLPPATVLCAVASATILLRHRR